MASETLGLLILLLSFIGAAYLFFVMILAVKQRGMIVWIGLLNIIIFIYTILFAPDLIRQYALSFNKVASGMGYTLISYMFMHANLLHITLNTFGLLFFGYNMEKEFGAAPTMMVYIVSGFMGGIVYILTSSPTNMVVGASAAIFGLMAYLTLTRPFKISPMPFLIPMPVALATVIYAILVIPVFLTGDLRQFGNVAQGAHLGGLLGGSLMAFGMNYAQALKGLIIVIIIAILVIILPPLFI
ncbi:TPA: rhomboid family intramembrane serine protease [archaeon]|uniref:Rhomboid family intramembrane serine protease n=1 Tax=Candidatus Naiadarchaeum limnaeum TaxID=2756139 RepID=A0A832V9Q6_9ARCH|nr:rhomboid family intramembrane serine protease [Candidatus Naiadarchaeum limnaeum]